MTATLQNIQYMRKFTLFSNFTLLLKKSFAMLINLLTQNVSSHSLMKVNTHSLSKKK